MAVMINGPVVIWKIIFRLVTHDQISLFQAHLHIRKEFLALSSGFLEGFCLWIIFLALALWIATRCDYDRAGIYPLLRLIHFSFSKLNILISMGGSFLVMEVVGNPGNLPPDHVNF
jgi:hypothetical protein